MAKRMNKKGAFTTEQLLALVLGGIALVVVVIGFTTGWGWFTDIFRFLPDDLSKSVQACESYVSKGGSVGMVNYCQFRMLNLEGKKQYANCDFIHEVAKRILTEDKITFQPQSDWCSTDAKKEFCDKIKGNPDFKSININDELCSK